MLLVMNKNATDEQIDLVIAKIKENGYTPRPIPGGERVSIGILYNQGPVDGSLFLGMPGVKDAIPVTRPYKLVSREFKPEGTIIRVGNVKIGNDHMTIIAGPCAVENESQALTIARPIPLTPPPPVTIVFSPFSLMPHLQPSPSPLFPWIPGTRQSSEQIPWLPERLPRHECAPCPSAPGRRRICCR